MRGTGNSAAESLERIIKANNSGFWERLYRCQKAKPQLLSLNGVMAVVFLIMPVYFYVLIHLYSEPS